MKKLLLPSVLAGLMICTPTTLVRADPVIYYSPYDWDTNVISGTYSGTDSFGIARTSSHSATPTPAGLLFANSASVIIPSGLGIPAITMVGVDATNDTTWVYTGGGTPVDYDEIPIFQFTGSVTGYGNIGNSVRINTYHDPYPLYVSGSYNVTPSSTTGSPLAQYTTSNPRTGALTLNAHFEGTMRGQAQIAGGNTSSTITGNSTAQVDYIVP